ncbi:AAA family ATPase [bacterium]|nr:AAA family ATPase [bacterium]
MQCSNCGFENSDKLKYCGECGAPLPVLCPNCSFVNPAQFKFCGQCGTRLTEPVSSHPGPGENVETRNRVAAKVPEAERRQLTVMFCDLVGSTALATKLDPEELREVVQQYQKACADTVNRFDGHIAQYLGDGVMVYFGYPVAHEDDARRAVRAGLEIVDATQKLNERLQRDFHESLAVRVGIHTGLVVIGEMGGGAKREQLALGTAPNIAARLQGFAEPNTVVISSATHHLVQGFFKQQSQGMRVLKGIVPPLEIFRVLNESGAHNRLEATMNAGLTPLVGKHKELQELVAAWQRVKSGERQAVLLNGEAGIGKSRLLHAFKQQLAHEPHLWLECHGSPYFQNSALHPLIEWLQRVLDFRREDACDVKTKKLESWLSHYQQPASETLPLFAGLLSVPLGDCYNPPKLNPHRLKQKTLEAWLAILMEMAQQQPVVLVVEDLHWADPSTLDMLNLLLQSTQTARLLALFTSRPEFMPPWGESPDVVQINLNRLTQDQVETMVAQVTGAKMLPTPVLRQIVTKTDGIPLFVEELTKMVLESGMLREDNNHFELNGALPPLAIPATLQDSLMARLDRLAPVKEVAQLAATLGREFSFELMSAVALVEETTLQQGLAQLVKAELLYENPHPNGHGATYVFKHALIQEAAYQTLLKSRRQYYHQRIAQTLVEKFYDTASDQPELLAHHYTEAGLIETAIAYWQWAGENAIQRSANIEAISHLTRGLDLLNTLPENAQRDQLELELLTYLGVATAATKGYTAPEIERIYHRARELCERVEYSPRQSSSMLGLWKGALVRADFEKALALAQECMRLAQKKQNAELLLTGHLTLGVTLASWGELARAQEHLTKALELYQPSEHRTDAFEYGEDPGVVCLSYLAAALWMLGYPEQALQRSNDALALAEKLAHPFTLALALNFNGDLHYLRREQHMMLERAERLIALAEEQGFPFWRACGEIQKGSALFERGQHDEALALIDQAVADLHAGGAQIGEAAGLAQRALAYGKMGRVEEGLQIIDEAIEMVKNGGERHIEAEQWRIKGELLLMQSDRGKFNGLLPAQQQQAEECFRRALTVAQQQRAKSWELRAAMSLSRLWQKQGKAAEATAFLSEIYHWFTEGFDTADLQEAKQLLGEFHLVES